MRKMKKLRNLFLIAAVCTGMLWLTLTGCSSGMPAGQSDGASGGPDPEQLQKLDLLNETAEHMYQFTVIGDVEEARNKLLAIIDQVSRIRFAGLTTIEGLHAFTGLLSEAKKTYNAASFSPERGKFVAAQIRLAADALAHRAQPMWMEHGKLLQEDLSRMEQAIILSDREKVAEAWTMLQRHYLMIRPSVLISRTPDEVNRMDSLLDYLRSGWQAGEIQSPTFKTGYAELRRLMGQWFTQGDVGAFMPDEEQKQPLLWILGFSATIILVLGYVAWRMFDTEKNIIVLNREK